MPTVVGWMDGWMDGWIDGWMMEDEGMLFTIAKVKPKYLMMNE